MPTLRDHVNRLKSLYKRKMPLETTAGHLQLETEADVEGESPPLASSHATQDRMAEVSDLAELGHRPILDESFINRSPFEILVNIFELVIRKDNSPIIGSLMLVCKYWYEIITQTPFLWSRIAASPTRGGDNLYQLAGFVDAAMRKSRDHPIEISLDMTKLPVIELDPSQPTRVKRPGERTVGLGALEVGVRHLLRRAAGDEGDAAKRWKSFTFWSSHTRSGTHELNELFTFPTPNLTYLSLHAAFAPGHWIPRYSMPDVSGLRTLILDTYAYLYNFTECGESLETLSFQFYLFQDMTQTLAPFKNLRNLAIDLTTFWKPPTRINSDDIELVHLTCLSIRFVHGGDSPVYHFKKNKDAVAEDTKTVWACRHIPRTERRMFHACSRPPLTGKPSLPR